MITRPTVLILGAGASIPYGFPSGKQLRNDVVDRLRQSNYGGWHDILHELEFTKSDISDFAIALSRSGLTSIDAFLEKRTEYMETGKTLIALGLLRYEEQHQLESLYGDETRWYEYFYNKLVAQTFENFISNKISIISFNYDRSLEQYLFTCLKYSFGKTDDECADLLKNIPIIHVHGKLGNLSWQAEKARQYCPTETAEEVKKAVEKIVVVSEVSMDSFEFGRAFELLAEAERILFLGFGYLIQNLSRLKIDKIIKINRASIYGTTYGMGNSDKAMILNKWGFKPEYFHDVLIHDFLMNYAKWD